MTAAGSRARSRELGYAEAMREVFHVADHQARKWRDAAGQQLDPAAHALALAMAGQLRGLADYAHGASMAYELPDLGEFLTGAVWDPRHGAPAPAELPGPSGS